jgi:hypothetical protein
MKTIITFIIVVGFSLTAYAGSCGIRPLNSNSHCRYQCVCDEGYGGYQHCAWEEECTEGTTYRRLDY